MPFSQHAEKAILRIFEGLSSPKSLAAYLLFKHGEWDQLVNLKAEPSHYFDPESYWRDAQAVALLKKNEDLPHDSKLLEENCVKTFFSCEAECFRANVRLYPLFDGASASPYERRLSVFFTKARKIISDVLGPCPDVLDGRHGPGSTYGDRGGYTTVADKMSSDPTLTSDAWPFLFQWSGTRWATSVVSSEKEPKFVKGNRFTTVPKDMTKRRGICIEPSINVFYQLGLGQVIRTRLSRHGLNLDEASDKHRRLACEASNNGLFATLDLSNASDTICRNLVKLLLPSSWYERLNDLRSKKTFISGKWVTLEKFSSMGNGFTFELETLIFAALTAAITGGRIGRDVFAFGDDLIFDSVYSEDVISMLRFCGFTPNRSKTFVSGPFRESCGGDFFSGRAVRPFYLKNSVNRPEECIAFLNGIRRSCSGNIVREYDMNRARLALLDGLPTNLRLFGPCELGDAVIHEPDSSMWWTSRKRSNPWIRYVRGYVPISFRKVGLWGFSDDAILASALLGHIVGEGYLLPRDAVTGYGRKWLAFS